MRQLEPAWPNEPVGIYNSVTFLVILLDLCSHVRSCFPYAVVFIMDSE